MSLFKNHPILHEMLGYKSENRNQTMLAFNTFLQFCEGKYRMWNVNHKYLSSSSTIIVLASRTKAEQELEAFVPISSQSNISMRWIHQVNEEVKKVTGIEKVHILLCEGDSKSVGYKIQSGLVSFKENENSRTIKHQSFMKEKRIEKCAKDILNFAINKKSNQTGVNNSNQNNQEYRNKLGNIKDAIEYKNEPSNMEDIEYSESTNIGKIDKKQSTNDITNPTQKIEDVPDIIEETPSEPKTEQKNKSDSEMDEMKIGQPTTSPSAILDANKEVVEILGEQILVDKSEQQIVNNGQNIEILYENKITRSSPFKNDPEVIHIDSGGNTKKRTKMNESSSVSEKGLEILFESKRSKKSSK